MTDRDWIAIGPDCRTLKQILKDVCERHDVSEDDVRGPSRLKYIANARHEFCAIAYDRGRRSLKQIGQFIGDRDHSTVLNSVRRHAQLAKEAVHIAPVPLADL